MTKPAAKPYCTARNFINAARIAVTAGRPLFVFDGPDGGYVVAGPRFARELEESGIESYTMQDLCLAISAANGY